MNEWMNETKNERENIWCDQAKRRKYSKFIYDSNCKLWIYLIWTFHVLAIVANIFTWVTAENIRFERIELIVMKINVTNESVYLTHFVANFRETSLLTCLVIWYENEICFVLFYLNLLLFISHRNELLFSSRKWCVMIDVFGWTAKCFKTTNIWAAGTYMYV